MGTPATAARPVATIEGGPEGTGTSYQWTITNNHSAPLIRVQVPHYRATLFLAPKGWSFSCTNLVAVGAKDDPGVCTASTEAAAQGIAPNRSASFGLQLAAGTIKRGSGVITVEFADGISRQIEGVLVPVQEGLGDRYIPLIGLGLVLAIVLVWETRKSRKKRLARPDAS